MNSVGELSFIIKRDSETLISLQIKLADKKRNILTRSQTDEIAALEGEIEITKSNIKALKETFDTISNTNAFLENSATTNASCDRNQQIKVPANLPCFEVSICNSQFDIVNFLDVFETRMLSHCIQQKHWNVILLSTVPTNDIPTLQWMQTTILSLTWNDTKNALLEHYSSAETERKFNNLFLQAKYKPNENLRYYTDYFQMCVSRAKLDSTSALVRDRFLHSLPMKLKDQIIVEASKCKTLDEITTLAINVSSIENSMTHFKSSPSAVQDNPIRHKYSHQNLEKYCDYHGNSSHTTEQCIVLKRIKNNEKNSNTNTQNKFPTTSTNTIASQPNKFSQTKTNDYKKNTIANLAQTKAEKTQLISLPITINNVLITAFLDTGSELTVLNTSLLSRINAKVTSSEISLNQAQSGSKLKIDGEIKDASIEFNGVSIQHDLVVANLQENIKCLIGIDLFRKFNLYIGGINFNQNTVQPNDECSGISEIPYDGQTKNRILDKIDDSLKKNMNTEGQFCNVPESIISLDTLNHSPSWVSQYHIPVTLQKVVDNQITSWLNSGTIKMTKTSSDWNSPLLVVKKHTSANEQQKYRVCLDPRHINSKLLDDKYPIPLLRDLLDEANGAQIFSSLDLEASYHQFFINESDQKKTCFCWRNIQYNFIGAPFGLKTLTSCFQRVMSQLLKDLPFTISFVDDIIVFSASPEEHIFHLQKTIQKLTDANLTLNLNKCKFGYKKIHVLGHYLSAEGIELDEKKIKCALEINEPKTGKDIQSFLGLTNFFRDFIPNYAKVTKPLDELRHCNTIGNLWNEEKQNSFNSIKQMLCNAPILSFPNQNNTFYVATDASNFAIGAALLQTKNDTNKDTFQGNVTYIKFASRSLTKCEQAYPVSKRELLGIVFAIKKFENYLLGRNFKILTDHEPLTYLLSQKRLGHLQTAWLDTLLRFNFEIIYIPGGNNLLPDLLSRVNPSSEIKVQASAVCNIIKDNTTSNTIQNGDNAGSQTNSTIQFDSDTIDEFALENTNLKSNIVLQNDSKQIEMSTIPDTNLQNETNLNSMRQTSTERNLKFVEDLHVISHESYDKLYKKCINAGYNWKDILKDCINVVKKCLRYSISKKGFHPQTNIHSNLPMKHVAMDLLGPLPNSNDQIYVLVLIDIFSRYIFLRSLPNKSALTVACQLFSIFCEYGHPEILQSDNGTEFVNSTMEELSSLYNWCHRRVVPYHPQGNGIAEAAVKATIVLLRKELDGMINWSQILPQIQLRLNQRITSITNSIPFEVMFARKLNAFKEFEKLPVSETAEIHVKNRLNEIQSVIYPAIEEISKQHSNKNARYWNKNHKLTEFQINSSVMIKNLNPLSKLSPRYFGPYKVIQKTIGGSYILADATENKLKRRFPPDQLKCAGNQDITDQYYVEKIIDYKYENSQDLFKVRWFGYTEQEDTWEPIQSFNDPYYANQFKQSFLLKGE